MDWLNILIFGIIPVLTVAVIFTVKRKLLWAAPFVSAVCAFVTYAMVFSPVTEILSNREWRGFFLLAMLMHLGTAAVLTAIAYLAAYILKRRKVRAG